MPIYSMTGFARVQASVQDQLSYTLSVKSVNHRFLDVQLRFPSGLDGLEMELRKVLKLSLIHISDQRLPARRDAARQADCCVRRGCGRCQPR